VGTALRAGTGVSAAALIAAMLAAVHAQHSVHYVSTSSAKTTKVVVVADVAKTQGIQRITFTQGGQTGHVTVIVANNTAFLRGDAFTLQTYLGLPAAAAQTVAGQWVRIPHTAREFAPVSEDVTLPSVALGLAVSGTVTKVKGGVRETSSSRTLTILLDAKHRPRSETGTNGGSKYSMTFSRWNETVHVAAPKKTVPVTELTKTTPGA
jgi:hypothetical protein